ncbi:hypothetical protein BJY04DRAFT_196811 [Aspergillus karnatakaensis]|uniref:uncharacterized protein n=1 Tax=Aspergillus karnatakaensis TaxID=1810916 RepID=UPI003CCC9AB6
MAPISSSVLVTLAVSLFSAVSGANDINVCKEGSCGDCPLIVWTDPSPECAIFEKPSFDNAGYEVLPSGGYALYLDIPQPEDSCAYIVGGSATPGVSCGPIIGRYFNAVCTRVAISSPISLSYCCGDCNPEEARVIPGNLTTRAIPAAKRDCDTFTQDGSAYETVGASLKVSDDEVGPGHIDVSKSVEVGRSTTFSASIGDPYGIISETLGVDFSESESTSLTYSLDISEGQNGYVAWAATMTCYRGTLSNCDDGVEETGEACTPKKDSDGNAVGVYTFVSTSKEVPPADAKRGMRFRY